MNEEMSDLPQAETADPDGVQVALRAAQTLWSRGDTSESLKWLRKAAESASDEGADVRSLQLAKAAAELRAKLLGGGDFARGSAGEISGAHPIADRPVIDRPVIDRPVIDRPVIDHPVVDPYAAPARPQAGQHRHSSVPIRPEGDPDSPSHRGGGHSSFPPAAYVQDPSDASSGGEHSASQSSRPVTATQYPSHRPRQRIGLTSSIPGAPPSPRDSGYGARESAYGARESAAYAAVPSWSADAERRVSAAPPPLPLAAIDDYEELEAEPDDEPGDDPGSVWSGAGESWRPPAPGADLSDGGVQLASGVESGAEQPGISSNVPPSTSVPSSRPPSRLQPVEAAVTPAGVASSALPPPLPPRGAFADDDGDFGPLGDSPTVVIPSVDDPDAGAAHEPRWTETGDVWDRESRLSGWDQDSGGAWAADLRGNGWASLQVGSSDASSDASPGFGLSTAASSGAPSAAAPSASAALSSAALSSAALSSTAEVASAEPPPPSDTARAKLTARVHHQAVRVSFAPDPRVPGQYVVRPLREGEKAAAGERIALLVALEPGVPLV
jgi:hypothetical protein